MLIGALLLIIGILTLAPAPFLTFLPQRLVLVDFHFNTHSCLKAVQFLEAPLRKKWIEVKKQIKQTFIVQQIFDRLAHSSVHWTVLVNTQSWYYKFARQFSLTVVSIYKMRITVRKSKHDAKAF